MYAAVMEPNWESQISRMLPSQALGVGLVRVKAPAPRINAVPAIPKKPPVSSTVTLVPRGLAIHTPTKSAPETSAVQKVVHMCATRAGVEAGGRCVEKWRKWRRKPGEKRVGKRVKKRKARRVECGPGEVRMGRARGRARWGWSGPDDPAGWGALRGSGGSRDMQCCINALAPMLRTGSSLHLPYHQYHGAARSPPPLPRGLVAPCARVLACVCDGHILPPRLV